MIACETICSTDAKNMIPFCKCGRPKREGGRYCLSCHAAYQRKWAKQQTEFARIGREQLKKSINLCQ